MPTAKLSAGLLLHRRFPGGVLEVLLVHPGGPFWARKDAGAWSIPKGEYDPGDDPWRAALREFEEELGAAPPAGSRIDLGELKQPSGKRVTAFAVESDFDAGSMRSNRFEMEWPRNSGTIRSFPEVDRAEWFSIAQARGKILRGQVAFLDRLMELLPGQCAPPAAPGR